MYKTKLLSDEFEMKIQSVLNTDNDTIIDDVTENVTDILISAAQSVLF